MIKEVKCGVKQPHDFYYLVLHRFQILRGTLSFTKMDIQLHFPLLLLTNEGLLFSIKGAISRKFKASFL